MEGRPPLGHIPGTAEVSEKLKIPEDRLVNYLQEKHGLRQDGPPVVRQFKHGQSNPTYYVAYGGEELVLRKKPVSYFTQLIFRHAHLPSQPLSLASYCPQLMQWRENIGNVTSHVTCHVTYFGYMII